MAEIERMAVVFPVMYHLVAWEFIYIGSTLFFNLFTLLSCIEKIMQSCDMLGCQALLSRVVVPTV